jgi:hypothetical protein
VISTSSHPDNETDRILEFRGLSPFLRLSINDIDLRPVGQFILERAHQDEENAALWMTLSNVILALGLRDLGVEIQANALKLQRIYTIPATEKPAKLKLLALMAPGDLSANTPIECLLEHCDIELIFYYLSPDNLFAEPVPEHDIALVAVSEGEEFNPYLVALESILPSWPKPVINLPSRIPLVRRVEAGELLQDIPGLLMPPTFYLTREQLSAIAKGEMPIPTICEGCEFPVIIRPVDSHGGRDLDKAESPEEVMDYLSKVEGNDFFISRFVDYRTEGGLFRKFRIALIDGEPFVCHMGISSHWMIHYVNAGMYEDAEKRAEECAFMENFDAFAKRHQIALQEIYQRTQLDYLCIDCAETSDGQFLVFELGHAMVVHAMDSEELFPHKQYHMRKVLDAFRQMLLNRMQGLDAPYKGLFANA